MRFNALFLAHLYNYTKNKFDARKSQETALKSHLNRLDRSQQKTNLIKTQKK